MHHRERSDEFPGTDRFQVVERLGAGGTGAVYAVFDRTRGRQLALKTLRALDTEASLRFKARFRALQEIQHRNLVRLEEVLEAGGTWFFTMELVDGEEILAHLRSSSPPPLSAATAADVTPAPELHPGCAVPGMPRSDAGQLRALLRQLARGVQAIHQAGLLHRNLKPSNVLVTTTGRLVIVDPGLIAGSSPGHTEERGEEAGALAYVAPERLTGGEPGPATDWYSVGVILYEALTGHLPWPDRETQMQSAHSARVPHSPASAAPACDADLSALAMALLAPDPEVRAGADQILQVVGQESDAAAGDTEDAHGGPLPGHPFVGRGFELEFLEQAHANCSGVHPSVIVVDGPSGIGKSELIRQFGHRLQQSQPAVVLFAGRCYERESVPYKAWDGVIDALARHLASLPTETIGTLLPPGIGLLAQVFPVLRQVSGVAEAATDRDNRSDPREMRQRVFQVLRELLSRLSLRHSLVIAIDDFHWADNDSRALLREILHPRGAPALLLLLVVRSEALNEPALRDIAGRNADFVRLPLGELGRQDAHRLINLLGPALTSEESRGIIAETRGHPLFLLEMVRHVTHYGSLDQPLRFDDVLWSRVEQLDPESRKLLEVLAAAGTPLAQETARIACGLDPKGFDRALAHLRAAHLGRSSGNAADDAVETYHDRVRTALLNRLDDAARRHLYDRIASALISTDSATRAPQSTLPHLIAARRFAAASDCAEVAAQQALEAMAFDQGAELLRTALELTEATEDPTAEVDPDTRKSRRLQLQLKLGEALVNAGRGREAAETYLQAAASAPPELQLECRRIAGEEFLISGHITRGVATLNQVLAELGEYIPPTPHRAGLSILKNQFLLRLHGLRWTPRAEKTIPRPLLAHLDTLKAVATGFGVVDSIRGLDYQTRCLRMALKLGEESRIARAMLREAMYASTRGKRGRKRSQELIERSRSLVAAADSPFLNAWSQVAEGFLAYFGGCFPEAIHVFSQAETAIRETCTGHNWELSSARLFLLFSLRHAGEFARLHALFDDYLRDALRRGDLYTATTLNVAAGSVRLLDDDRETIQRELRNMRWSPREAGFHVQHFYELRVRGELALYEGRAAVALESLELRFQQLARSLLPRIQMVRIEALHLQGRLLVAAARSGTAGGRRQTRRIRRIIKRLQREDVGFAHLYAHLLAAALQMQEGRTAASIASLQAAIATARQTAMQFHLAAAQLRLGEVQGGDSGQKLVAASHRWLRQEGVRNPRRLMEVAAPGFNSLKPA